MDTNDETSTDDTAAIEDEQTQLPVRLRSALARVEAQTRERPLAALAVAAGLGVVLGRGLPRIGALVGLVGVGGLVGFAAIALRNRFAGPAEGDDTTDDDDDSADTSDDAHDLHVSSSIPAPDAPRRKPKKPNIVGGA